MAAFLSAVPWPTSIHHVQQAGLPTEPEAIAVYVLLLISGWAVWQGNRGSAPTPDDETKRSSKQDDGREPTSKGTKPRGSGRRARNKAKRRRQGRIDWIQ